MSHSLFRRVRPNRSFLLGLAIACAWFSRVAAEESRTVHQAGDFPSAFTHFEPYAGNPVFVGGGADAWDAQIRERGWILRDGDHWRLYYTGYNSASDGARHLGMATSNDGLHWTRDSRNPLLADQWLEDMMVLQHDGMYYMFAEGAEDQTQWLTSPDGDHWTHKGTVDIRLTDGEPIPPGPFGTPFVLRKEGKWQLLYERKDLGVWLATSDDLQVWRNVSDAPVIEPGPGGYDKSRIALNQVVEHDGRYYATYHASDDLDMPALWTINLAVSDDLSTWTKYPGNPLFPKQANRSSPQLVPMPGGTFRLYTMHGRVEAFLPAKGK